jgi:hypothetical protein
MIDRLLVTEGLRIDPGSGSQPVLHLVKTGVKAGTYNEVQVDALGRIINGKKLSVAGPEGPPGPRGKDGDVAITALAGVQQYTAGEAIGSPRAIMIVSGQAFRFDPSAEANAHKLVGVSASAAAPGGVVSVVEVGQLDSLGAFVQNSVYYAGALGVLTSTVPTSGVLVKLGIAKNTGTLIVEMSEPVILI